MLRHRYFPDLLLHSDAELAQSLGSPLVERRTVHEWPLSCVQRLTTGDGRSFAYKAQLPPTVEPEFYRRACSQLLPGHRELDPAGECSFLLIDWIQAPSLGEVAEDPYDLVARGRELIDAIAMITGDLPHYLDLGTASSWNAAINELVAKAATLIADRRISSIDRTDLGRLAAWAAADDVIERATEDTRLINADLRPDQVLLTTDGYRVLDWQRPVITSPEVDLVSLLTACEIEPRDHLDPFVDRLFWLIRLEWAIRCQHDLFPDAAGTYDGWARQAVDRILS